MRQRIHVFCVKIPLLAALALLSYLHQIFPRAAYDYINKANELPIDAIYWPWIPKLDHTEPMRFTGRG